VQRFDLQLKADSILSVPLIKRLKPGFKLTFITVVDIIVDGAYEDAVKGVKFIVHLASPVIST